MCGIAGFWDVEGLRRDAPEVLRTMSAAIRHRGPDDEGTWADAESGVALAHRRLSILDLSPLGHQPMSSSNRRFVVVLNGEIYNFQDLRIALVSAGVRFRGRSDTEVALAAFERWGVLESVRRFSGMFAFAAYDRRERVLHLVRDRLGEKPLYYGWTRSTLLFGSQLNALRAHPDFRCEIDRGALSLFFQHGCVPAPHSIYVGIRKVVPGTMLSFAAPNAGAAPHEIRYWSAREVAERGYAQPMNGTEDEIADELDAALRRTVRAEMVADVPLGGLLSGGIDSSLVVALMQAESTRPVRTFTIGFPEPAFNEAEHARGVARHLRTQHTDLYVTGRDAQGVVPRLPGIFDEPFSDASQIPTLLVAQLTRQHVTVSLSGDGGDELFGGYDRYARAEKLHRAIRLVPMPLRRCVAGTVSALPARQWDRVLRTLDPIVPQRLRRRLSGYNAHRFAQALRASQLAELNRVLISHWLEAETVVPTPSDPRIRPVGAADHPCSLEGVSALMYTDSVSYLPDDLLVKVDRAAMSVGLENRAPFLDHRIYELAWQVPAQLKWSRGVGKRILRKVLARYVPPSLVDRPKMGFGVPIGAWLRGPLRDWAYAQLDDLRLRQEGLLLPRVVLAKWHEHLSGARDWAQLLWDVLMFQSWVENR